MQSSFFIAYSKSFLKLQNCAKLLFVCSGIIFIKLAYVAINAALYFFLLFSPLLQIVLRAVKKTDSVQNKISVQETHIKSNASLKDSVNTSKKKDALTTGDTSVIIAIVDDGFDLVHPDLIKKNTFPYNVRTQNKNVFGNNQHTHGTHVAGIALANNNNNFGLSGIAPNCGFMPIQISDNSDLFTSTDVIDGILYAIKHKADVINLSLGKQFSERLSEIPISEQESIVKTSAKDEEYFWKELFEYSNKENVTIVLAAGNQNILIGLDPMQRSEFGIVVSAINQNFEKANFSNYGETSTISAPGVGIYSCIPNKQFISYDGTSMSAPIVTGAVALMKTVNPKLTNLEIINILKTSGKKLNTNGLGPLLQIDKAVLAAKEKKTQ